MSSPDPSQPQLGLPFGKPQSHVLCPPSSQFEQDTSPDLAPTHEPFPIFATQPSFQYNASLHPLDTASPQAHPTIASPHAATPLSAGLRLQTDHLANKQREDLATKIPVTDIPQQTVFNAGLPVRSSSVRSILSSRTHRADSLSPGSAISSPGVGPLVDMTPLPSPISAWGSPGLWRTASNRSIGSQPSIVAEHTDMDPEPMDITRTSPKKRKLPFVARGLTDERAQIYNANMAAHARNRSLSEYAPEGMQIPRSRNIVVSTSGAPLTSQAFSPPNDLMHREEYLAVQRGLAISAPKPPTPPDSNLGMDSGDLESPPASPRISKGPLPLVYEAYMVRGGKLRRWKALRELGKGTFSTVMLATSQISNGTETDQAYAAPLYSSNEDQVDRKSLVAVKICEQGPAGGADEKKIEISIKRELEIMKSIHHPSLVHLKAVNFHEREAFLVLNYCAGGDLFELASSKLEILTPTLVRRMFAELVAAVQCLHLQYIVHRDIKLENVLVNLPNAAFANINDWQTYPFPVVTLTDLGLGRWIPRPPESPLLDTRCGSEDYAAPEVLIGQEYDGRVTDAWALGVLLYALMEGRLPFDPVPGSRKKKPTSHRIATCEWQWVRFADDDGEWDPTRKKEFEGAREIVEGLLVRTRSRWSLEKVQKTEWVDKGISVEGGLRREEDPEGDE